MTVNSECRGHNFALTPLSPFGHLCITTLLKTLKYHCDRAVLLCFPSLFFHVVFFFSLFAFPSQFVFSFVCLGSYDVVDGWILIYVHGLLGAPVRAYNANSAGFNGHNYHNGHNGHNGHTGHNDNATFVMEGMLLMFPAVGLIS